MRFTTWISLLPTLAIALLFPSSAEPFAYISNAGDGTVSVIDTTAHTVVDTTARLGGGPVGISMHPDQGQFYVAFSQSDVVRVFDTATHSLIDTINVGDSPQSFGHLISSAPEPAEWLAMLCGLPLLR